VALDCLEILLIKYEDDFTVPNPEAVVKVTILNPVDTRRGQTKLKGLSLQGGKLFQSTTILEVKRWIGQTYGMQPTSFSLVTYSEYSRFGIGSQYMCSFTDQLCIGEICTDRRMDLVIVWHGESS